MNKNRYSLRKDNKGAALVSVLIAIAFISILASALLYMSYQNYRMKAISGFSKNNFYEAESGLNTLSARVRNNLNAAGSSVRNELANYCTDATCVAYDTEKLAKVVYPTASGHKAGNDYVVTTVNNGKTEKVTFTSGDGYAVLDESANGFEIFRFKGVEVKKDVLDSQGNTMYSNNVKSDIVFVIKNLTMAEDAGGVGNCSMLFDAPLQTSTAEKTNVLNVYGNSYVANAVFTGAESIPGQYTAGNNAAAIWLSKETKINVIGDYFVVYGDLVLDGSSSLCLYGKSMTVYGDIILKDKGVLVCNASSKIYMVKSTNLPGRPVGNRTGIYVWKNGALSQNADDIKKHVFPANRADSSSIEDIAYSNFEDFRTKLHYDDADASNDGIIQAMIKKITVKGQQVSYKDLYNVNSPWGTNVPFKGVNTGVKFNTAEIANGSDFNNKLVFNTYNGTVTIRDTNVCSTIISDTPIKIEQQHDISLTRLGDDVFEFLRIKSTDSSNPDYNANIHHFKNYDVKNMNLNGQAPYISPGDFFKDDCNQTVNLVMSYSVNGGGGQNVTYSSVSFENWIKDKE